MSGLWILYIEMRIILFTKVNVKCTTVVIRFSEIANLIIVTTYMSEKSWKFLPVTNQSLKVPQRAYIIDKESASERLRQLSRRSHKHSESDGLTRGSFFFLKLTRTWSSDRSRVPIHRGQ